jgi:hypothetical protein
MLINDLVIGAVDELMLKVSKLHFPLKPKGRRLRVADVTYRQGFLWKQIDTTKFDFYPSDPDTGGKKIDFRKLPYDDDFLDVGVIDPPWLSICVWPDRYGSLNMPSPRRLMERYRAGMTELHRALRPGGIMVVKCRDTFRNGKQIRLTEIVRKFAVESLGMIDVDKFHLFCSIWRPALLRTHQKTARQVVSVMWILRK